jgi:hypothetical protein
MPKVKISEFDTVAANNTDIDGINLGEGMLPSDVNNAMRELMAQLKDFQAGTAGDSFNGPIGASTAAAGSFTTIGATGDVSIADKIVHTGDTNTAIRFPAADTVTVETSGAERLRIDASGGVGIGVSSVTTKVDILGTQVLNRGVLQVIDNTAQATGTGAGITLGGTFTSAGAVTPAVQIKAAKSNSTSSNYSFDMAFLTYANGNADMTERMRIAATGNIVAGFAVQETRIVIAASDINLNLGNFFTRTISGTTTLTVSNIPTSGTTASFILDLTNGGSATVNWWSNVKWAGGTPPTLTSAGRDSLGFYTHDGGTTWTGLLLGRDIK